MTYVSVTIRKIILYQSQNLSALLVNCLTLASVEVVSRSLTYSCQIIMLGFRMQHLNTRTLGELVDLHTAVQRSVDGITLYMFVDQFVEIFVFVMITSQDMSAPIWSSFRVWRSVEAWDARIPFIFAEGAIQMGVEFLSTSSSGTSASAGWPGIYRRSLGASSSRSLWRCSRWSRTW